MYKLFNRISYRFSQSFDIAVIGGGPGGNPFFTQDTSQPSRQPNLDSTQSASKKEDPSEEHASMLAAFHPKPFSTFLTNITNSSTTSKHSE